MTCLLKSINFRPSWCMQAFAPLLLLCIPTVAQHVPVPAPMAADAVMKRVVTMNEVRAKALDSYTSLRSYHLKCNGLISNKAEMVVRAEYRSPNKTEFNVVSESGSGTVRHKVFRALLDAELESMQPQNRQRSAVTSENYTFSLLEYQKTDNDDFYVIEAKPRSRNKFLFRGRIWVDAKDFAITRVEGEPAVNPSRWTRKTDFIRTYRRVGDVWLPASNESETKVGIFATAVLTIKYENYEVRKNRVASVDVTPKVASSER